MITVKIYADRESRKRDANGEVKPFIKDGYVEIYDGDEEVEAREFSDGLFVKDGLAWLGRMSTPGYLCVKFDLLTIEDALGRCERCRMHRR